jgi:hypothetical protein
MKMHQIASVFESDEGRHSVRKMRERKVEREREKGRERESKGWRERRGREEGIKRQSGRKRGRDKETEWEEEGSEGGR